VLHRGTTPVWDSWPTVTNQNLYSVWCAAPDTTIAVGEAGSIIERHGATWTPVASPTQRSLLDVAGRPGDRHRQITAYAVGSLGVVLERDPRTGAWSSMESGVDVVLMAVGLGPDKAMYAAGYGGVMIRLGAEGWEHFDAPTTETIRSLSRAPGGQLFAAGGTDAYSGVVLMLDRE
jgi:hypothetical protein